MFAYLKVGAESGHSLSFYNDVAEVHNEARRQYLFSPSDKCFIGEFDAINQFNAMIPLYVIEDDWLPDTYSADDYLKDFNPNFASLLEE